ncbi:thiol reductant ABC exporter subunit CydC [Stenotrophomonas sp. HITSZ_GD]|uniref:thiol reductant ABC exporter subunit CydC n=1 Tax=Stenotrophomonas sp. HITSZ_GD TaxID=3037248 RepID=UPI00240DA6DA|nr:thiol reductant ABC exporter subunit CydC [Stenotrophomonas sp. HITSZ_GD]MDG2526466.1 thiol reductant ABC exporter subunit CydC [Stenotrophomonas sp. HITSZ_GD]
MSARHPDGLWAIFARHRARLLLCALLVWLTMLAGVGLLSLSGGFLVATALAAALAADFNFFSPSAGVRGLTMLRIASRYAEKLVGHDATLRIARDLRVWFFRRALPLAPARLGARRIGELMTRLMSDIAEVDGLVVRALAPLAALVGIGVAGIAAAALIYLPAAVLLAVLALAIGLLVPWQVARGAREREAARAAQRMALRTLAFEGLEGAADLAAVEATAAWIQRVDAAADAVTEGDQRRRGRLVVGQAWHGVCAAAGLAGMLWLTLGAAARGVLAPEMAAALVFMTLALLEVWAGAGLAWQALFAGRVAAQRLDEIVDAPPSVADPGAPRAVPAHGALCFDQVVFAWPGAQRPVLDGVDLVLQPGERIAIGGDSGSGKSTLSSLLLRLWDPQAGEVRYGGIAVREFAQADWHRQVAWMPQNAPVFAGSVAENLRLGAPGADDAALWAVLGQVRLADWAHAREGLATWVGENGATLSAGQARRLALARALLRDAPLLVLDEPTDGLDVDTADALLVDLAAALEGRSLLMITHGTVPDGVVHAVYRLRDGRLARG